MRTIHCFRSSIMLLCMLFASISSWGSNSYGLVGSIQEGTILHCFDWTYNDIKSELPNIAKAGFTTVQTSPAQPGASTGVWYWLYQPLGFYVGTNELGTKDNLKSLCTEADNYGIKIVVDVVANHLAGDHSNIESDLKDSQYWHTYTGSIDYSNRWQITHGQIGMPDLNSESSYVQSVVANYVNELKDCGVDGIRWDAAKHIGLPSEDCNFWPAVTTNSGAGLWNYGEILEGPTDSGSDALMTEYSKYISVTDNNYGRQVTNAFNGNSTTSVAGNWSFRGVANNKLVYWAESHDTYANDGGETKNISQNVIDRSYAVVAAQNGATSLYFSRPYETAKESIKSGVKGSTHFTSSEVAAVNHFHNALNGEASYYSASNGVASVCRKGGAVIVKASGSGDITATNGGSYTTPGTYTDEVTGNTFTVTSTTITGSVGSAGIAVFYTGSSEDVDTDTATIPSCATYVADKYFAYFEAPNSWSSAYSYLWNDNGSIAGAWPGTQMENVGTTTSGKTVYKWTGDATATGSVPTKIIFNAGSNSTQTGNLTFTNGGYYTVDGLQGTITKTDSTKDDTTEIDTSNITIYVKCSSAPYLYAWDSNKKNITATWPGDKMTQTVTANGSSWYYYTFSNVSPINIILNNGSGSQTSDITNITASTYFEYNGSTTATDVTSEQSSSIPACCTYISTGYFAYFKAPSSWSSVYVWPWIENGANLAGSGCWPGDKIDNVGNASDGCTIYLWTGDNEPTNIIFSNNGASQTADLTFSNGGYYTVDGLLSTISSSSQSAKVLTLGINNVANTANKTFSIYNMNGQRVIGVNNMSDIKKLSKGIYIINNKKYVTE
nr:starch-binding protein [Prevotella sp.]